MSQETILSMLALEAEALRKKLAAVEATIVAYGGEVVPTAKQIAPVADPNPEPQRSASPRPRRGKNDALKEFLETHFRSTANTPVALGDLYEVAVGSGFEIGGKDPKSTLSALLSNDDRFTNEGRIGWRLVDYPPGETGGQSVGGVAERSIAADSNSAGAGPQKAAPGGSNPSTTAQDSVASRIASEYRGQSYSSGLPGISNPRPWES